MSFLYRKYFVSIEIAVPYFDSTKEKMMSVFSFDDIKPCMKFPASLETDSELHRFYKFLFLCETGIRSSHKYLTNDLLANDCYLNFF